MVVGGDATDIANAIELKRLPGCTLVGGHTENVVDSQGVSHAVRFDIRGEGLTDTPIYVAIHATPALGGTVQTAIAAAIVAWSKGLLQRDGTVLQEGQSPTGEVFPAFGIGGTVPWASIFAPINAVPGAVGITAVDIGLTASPTLQADIVLAYNQLAIFDATTITFV